MPAVLVIDDAPASLDFAGGTLRAAGFEVRTTAQARAAMDLMQAQPFDLVLLEMILPEQEGIETILEIRARWPDHPVVAMSGGGAVVSSEEALSLARAVGADGVLQKPFSASELLRMVRKVLGRRARG